MAAEWLLVLLVLVWWLREVLLVLLVMLVLVWWLDEVRQGALLLLLLLVLLCLLDEAGGGCEVPEWDERDEVGEHV